MKTLCLLVFLIGLAPASLPAQTLWTNGAGNSLWSDAGNWSAGVPNSASATQISTQPTDDFIGIDVGAGNVTVASLTFNNTLTAPVSILTIVDQLTVGGNIANLSGFGHTLNLVVNAGASATYAGGSGLSFSTLNVGTRNIATTGNLAVLDTLIFDINSATAFGTIGAIDAAGAMIELSFHFDTTTLTPGTTFDFTTGSFAGSTLGSLPGLANGMSWNTNAFASSGVLSVVPEPSSFILLCAAAFLSNMVRPRRKF